MSREARDWVWNDAPVDDPRDLLILLSIADVADEKGGGAYPSQARLARDCRSSDRTVRSRLKGMVDTGVLAVEKPSNQHRPTTYCIPALQPRPEELSTLDSAEVAPGRNQAGTRPEKDGQNEGGTPSIGIGSGSARGARAGDLEAERGKGKDYRFGDAWTAYPSRGGRKLYKALALEQWKKLTYAEKGRAWQAVQNMAREKPELPPDMYRWLRNRVWEDWAQPSPASPAAPAAATQTAPYPGGVGVQRLPNGKLMGPMGEEE